MKDVLTLLCCFLIGAPLAAAEMPIRFTPRLLTVDLNEGIDLADVNNDGRLDVLAGRNWFAAPDSVPRPIRTIPDWNQYAESNGDFTYDINGDGYLDVLSGSFLPTEVYWFENPGEPALSRGELWKPHLLVNTELSENERSFFRDLDGDGVPEWITNSWNKKNPTIAWKLEPGDPPRLQKNVIGESGNGHGMAFGDLNNDGREDILVGTGWYERPEGHPFAGPWMFHPDWDLEGSVPMLVSDLDGDGRNDLIWGKGHDYGIYWWQSMPSESGELVWKPHVIDESFSQPHALHLADLDGDGRQELITGKRVRAHNGKDPGSDEPACIYYYEWNPGELRFTRFTIIEGDVGIGLQIRTGDLNGDGRTDIAVAGKAGTYILFNEGK